MICKMIKYTSQLKIIWFAKNLIEEVYHVTGKQSFNVDRQLW